MSVEDSFNFSLLRISIAQILKAHGFDKCRPSQINILADLYIGFFNKLVQECLNCSQARTHTNLPELQDVVQSMINIGLIKTSNPLLVNDDVYNPEDEEKQYNTKSVYSFRDWVLRSYGHATTHKLNQVPQNLIDAIIEKRKLDNDDAGETAAEKRRRKHKERQEFYNQLKLNDDQQKQAEEHHRRQEEAEDNKHRQQLQREQQLQQQQLQQLQQLQLQLQQLHDNEDVLNEGGESNGLAVNVKTSTLLQNKRRMTWLNYLLEKDLKLGHDLKFLHANEYILDEFLKFQNDENFHPAETNTDLSELIKESDARDYIVSEIPRRKEVGDEARFDFIHSNGNGDETNDGNTDSREKDRGGQMMGKLREKQRRMKEEDAYNQELLGGEEKMRRFLPYNVKYSEVLLTDDVVLPSSEEKGDVEMGEGNSDDEPHDKVHEEIHEETHEETHEEMQEGDYGGYEGADHSLHERELDGTLDIHTEQDNSGVGIGIGMEMGMGMDMDMDLDIGNGGGGDDDDDVADHEPVENSFFLS